MNKTKLLPFVFLFLIASIPSIAKAQKRSNSKAQNIISLQEKPKLVVGLVVDQMRYDYLTRFWDHFGDGGFKRLANEGFNCKNNHFNYVPTYTGPGHASVYTGSTPSMHGIIGNDWYDKDSGKSVYCVGDEDYASVGTMNDAGKMSPHRMNTTTITDELRLHTQMRGKVIAISLKDRGAVLPGGHTANAAYWMHGEEEGSWISSTYYMDQLPKWVMDFNASTIVEDYKKPWDTLKDIATYLESGTDNNPYEGMFNGETTTAFPHNLPLLWDANGKYSLLKSTPFGNSITTDFAMAALDGEKLGEDAITDFLAVSFSSTDYVGHMYGVNSKEVQDTYIRLDLDLERLLKTLDKKVGKGEYTVFLTSDHGANEVPAYLKDQKIPAGYIQYTDMQNKLNKFVEYTFGSKDIIKNISNSQIFLNHAVIKGLDLSLENVQETIAIEMLGYDGVERAYTAYQMWKKEYTKGIPYMLQNGYNQKRSGDVLLVLKPATVQYSKTGSTHGSSFTYDTHVPLLFYGMGIKKGSTFAKTEIPDIAPTIASLLGIAFPNGATGKPIVEVLE
ncbi:alkaline phosphatase family protein [Flavobacteriaceae bacterium KMM 6898]|nr:alkaline phosphatase family protein [Flavobacteriaceae bacterium KMM 6898]